MHIILFFNCQALSISQSLNLSLSLRDRDRADTIITFHHHHRKLFKHLKVTYSQVWYIIGIVRSSPTHFHSEKIGLIRVTYDPPVCIRVNKYYSYLYSSVIHYLNRHLKSYWFPLRKNRVNWGHLWPPVSIRVNISLSFFLLQRK